ncbi:hypothetical protein IWW48_001673 [Coemansia sp. RSA 1200]|nr:hypothetical protein IWW48_001673 [Coemansia sp. RSA 1200]
MSSNSNSNSGNSSRRRNISRDINDNTNNNSNININANDNDNINININANDNDNINININANANININANTNANANANSNSNFELTINKVIKTLKAIKTIQQILLLNFTLLLRTAFSWLDNLQYRMYRAAGCFQIEDSGGSSVKEDAETESSNNKILRLQVLKGKDIPRRNQQDISSQFVVIRLGTQLDYCFPVANTSGSPRFAMTSYFHTHAYDASNTLIEITVYKDGMYVDSVVGRVTIPLKELEDVRDFHGWLALDSNNMRGDPAGYVYLDSRLRTQSDGEFRVLQTEQHKAMSQSFDKEVAGQGHQRKRGLQKRYDARLNARRHRYADDQSQLDNQADIRNQFHDRVLKIFSRKARKDSRERPSGTSPA